MKEKTAREPVFLVNICAGGAALEVSVMTHIITENGTLSAYSFIFSTTCCWALRVPFFNNNVSRPSPHKSTILYPFHSLSIINGFLVLFHLNMRPVKADRFLNSKLV